ncbi:MAG TPA: hypothetical protein DEP72_06570 [Clostridiales bacterium]|nr:MAG: hypothetical protein A2Y18_03535 [Clostridiales bacterium GWD2_32_19]HCC07802.1 hypothetical protein [Clostridiales bacterium]
MLKKILYLISICILLSSCSKDTSPASTMRIPTYGNNSKVIQEYIQMKNQNTTAKDIMKFLDKNTDQLSQNEAADIILDVLDILSQSETNYNKKLKEQLFTINKQQIVELDDKALDKEIADNGYYIIAREGLLNVVVNCDFLKSRYTQILSEELKEYLDIKGRYVIDKIIFSSYDKDTIDELAEHIIVIEKYIDNYPLFIKIDEVKSIYEEYVKVYLDNYKTFNTADGKISAKYLESYENIVKKYKDSRLGKVVTDYLNALKVSEYKKTESVNNFISNVGSKIKLEEAKVATPVLKAVVTKKNYEEKRDVGSGLWAVKLNEKWGYIDEKDKEIIPVKYDYTCVHSFSGGQKEIIVKQDGRYGAFDGTGKQLLPCIYSGLKIWNYSIAKGFYSYLFVNEKGDIFSTKGEKIGNSSESSSKDNFMDVVVTFKNGNVIIKKSPEDNKKYFMQDWKGNFLLNNIQEIIRIDVGFVAKVNGKYGAINVDGDISSPFIYESYEIICISPTGVHFDVEFTDSEGKRFDGNGKLISDKEPSTNVSNDVYGK